jgi:hypothetical protein
MIFNVLGTPAELDVDFLEREDARRYLQEFAPREGQGLQDRCGHAGGAALDLLEGALCFDPRERLTVNDMLGHKVFQEVRNPAREVEASCKAQLDFETGQVLDELLLRTHFLKEMGQLNSRASIAATAGA